MLRRAMNRSSRAGPGPIDVRSVPDQEMTSRTEALLNAGAQHPWIVMQETTRARWGGDLRRAQIFRRLAERTDAVALNGWSLTPLRMEYGLLRLVLPRPWRNGAEKPRLASAEQMRPDILRMSRRVIDPAAVAIYDDPIVQATALGYTLEPKLLRYYRERRKANLGAFRWHVVPTLSFGELIGLDMTRVIVAGNGTNTDRIVPGTWPEDPAIGMVSGAAPGRGIETLVSVAAELREEVPQLRLLLWLVSTGDESEAYLQMLRHRHARDRWIEIGGVDYGDLSLALRQATCLVIPNPPQIYHDVGLPVKLFDSMAAGRPLVVTPRLETRAIVERHGAGLVTAGDHRDDLAESLRLMLTDEPLARRMGAAAREAAERHYHWPVVGDRLATVILEREGAVPS